MVQFGGRLARCSARLLQSVESDPFPGEGEDVDVEEERETDDYLEIEPQQDDHGVWWDDEEDSFDPGNDPGGGDSGSGPGGGPGSGNNGGSGGGGRRRLRTKRNPPESDGNNDQGGVAPMDVDAGNEEARETAQQAHDPGMQVEGDSIGPPPASARQPPQDAYQGFEDAFEEPIVEDAEDLDALDNADQLPLEMQRALEDAPPDASEPREDGAEPGAERGDDAGAASQAQETAPKRGVRMENLPKQVQVDRFFEPKGPGGATTASSASKAKTGDAPKAESERGRSTTSRLMESVGKMATAINRRLASGKADGNRVRTGRRGRSAAPDPAPPPKATSSKRSAASSNIQPPPPPKENVTKAVLPDVSTAKQAFHKMGAGAPPSEAPGATIPVKPIGVPKISGPAPKAPKGPAPPVVPLEKATLPKEASGVPKAAKTVGGVRRKAPAEHSKAPPKSKAKGKAYIAEYHGYAACFIADDAEEKAEQVFVVQKGRNKMYQLWLSDTGTEAAEEKRLTWKERRLGKEVPRKLQRKYFIESQKAEVQRWKDTHAVKSIKRSEAENLISCRFLNRWQEKPTGKKNEALGTQVTATSRLCARGFRDAHWWIKKSSPTVRRHTQRCLQHESVQRNWRVCTRDARRAFLQVEKLLRRVCMEPPREAGEGPDTVWLLLKPVYGIGDMLHESGRIAGLKLAVRPAVFRF